MSSIESIILSIIFSIALLTRQTLSFIIGTDGLPSARHKRVVPLGTRIEIFSIRLSIINMAAFRGGLCCGIIDTHPQDRFERDAPLVWVSYPEGLFLLHKKRPPNTDGLFFQTALQPTYRVGLFNLYFYYTTMCIVLCMS